MRTATTSLADYLLSNAAIESLRVWMRAQYGDAFLADDGILGVDPSYLQAAWDSVEQNFGSFNGYLDAIGIDDDVVTAHPRATDRLTKSVGEAAEQTGVPAVGAEGQRLNAARWHAETIGDLGVGEMSEVLQANEFALLIWQRVAGIPRIATEAAASRDRVGGPSLQHGGAVVSDRTP